jgi:hypothetical protein
LRIATANSGAADDADQFVGVSEAIAAAEEITADVNVGLERDLEVQRKRLVRIESEAKRKGWLKSAPLCAALAAARAELGDLPEAIDYYSAAIKNENAGFKLRAVEQLATARATLSGNFARRRLTDVLQRMRSRRSRAPCAPYKR